MDQFNFALDAMGEQTMHLVIAFDGRMDPARLDAACREAFATVPVLCCRFVAEEAPYWERIPVPDHILEIVDTGDAESDLARVLGQPLDPAAGPQAQFCLLRGESDTLCITVHHAAMDARGILALSSLLARCYRREHAGTWRTADRTLGPVLGRVPCAILETTAPPPQPTRFVWSFPVTGSPAARRDFVIRTLPPEVLLQARTFCHLRDVTINDLLLAAYHAALCDMIRPGNGAASPLMLSIDLRRYLTAAGDTACDPCSNQSVAFEVSVPAGIRPFERAVSTFHAAMAEYKGCWPGIASALDLQAFGDAHFSAIRGRVRGMRSGSASSGAGTMFLGNIGIIPAGAVSYAPDLAVRSAFIAGIVIEPPSVALGVTTFCDRLTLTSGFFSPAVSRDAMEELLDRIAAYLSHPDG